MQNYFTNPNPALNPHHISELHASGNRFYHNHPQMIGSFSNLYDVLEHEKEEEHPDDDEVKLTKEAKDKDW